MATERTPVMIGCTTNTCLGLLSVLHISYGTRSVDYQVPGIFLGVSHVSFFFFLQPPADVGKIKLELTTLPRIFIRVVCRFNSRVSFFILCPVE